MANRDRNSRHYGRDWDVEREGHDGIVNYADVSRILLQEIRDELKQLNRLLHCENFVAIPSTMKRIAANTAKKRKAAK